MFRGNLSTLIGYPSDPLDNLNLDLTQVSQCLADHSLEINQPPKLAGITVGMQIVS